MSLFRSSNSVVPMRVACFAALALFLFASAAFAQQTQAPPAQRQAPRGEGAPPQSPGNSVVSPEFHADHSITIRLYAPKATDVSITADWLANIKARTGGTTTMTKGDDGVWTYTTPPLETTGHYYSFTVDGIKMADPVNPEIKVHAVRGSESLVEVPGTPTPMWQLQNVPRGPLEIVTQPSKAYNDEHTFAVYLPPDYHKSTARYPVLYLMHGSGDNYAGWTNAGNANIIMDNLIAQKKVVPMIIVMPYNGITYPHPQVRPAAGQSPFEDYMVKELIPYIDANYRTKPDRKHRAMAGLSAGSGATYNVGMNHTELISQFGLLSAGVLNTAAASRYPYLASGKETAAKLDLMWISCGTEDTDLAGIKDFTAIMDKNGVKYTLVTREGGHVWAVWRWSLVQFAPLLFR
jgi:enterochelin esterase-like enzyme